MLDTRLLDIRYSGLVVHGIGVQSQGGLVGEQDLELTGYRNHGTGMMYILSANHRANGAREYIGLASQTSG